MFIKSYVTDISTYIVTSSALNFYYVYFMQGDSLYMFLLSWQLNALKSRLFLKIIKCEYISGEKVNNCLLYNNGLMNS